MNYIPPPDAQRRLLSVSLNQLQEAGRLKTAIEARDIPARQAELAARLQYQPASIALSIDLKNFDRLDDFFRPFFKFSKEAWLRMVVAVVRPVLPIWERTCPDNSSPTRTVASAERWILNPSESAKHESGRLKQVSKDAFLKTPIKGTPLFVARAATFVGKAVTGSADNGCFNYCYEAIKGAAGCLAHPDAENDDAVFAAEKPSRATIEKVIRLMRAEVVPWALGYSDPVAKRHSA